MLIGSEIILDLRGEDGGYIHLLSAPAPAALTAGDFKPLDGGQFIEMQQDLMFLLNEKPLPVGRYRIHATYQNYELGKTIGLEPSCAGDSILLEGGPAWTGRVFSDTVMIEV